VRDAVEQGRALGGAERTRVVDLDRQRLDVGRGVCQFPGAPACVRCIVVEVERARVEGDRGGSERRAHGISLH
jgi:hypothetical protein